ncbi:Endonuclease III [Entamoeba marina]
MLRLTPTFEITPNEQIPILKEMKMVVKTSKQYCGITFVNCMKYCKERPYYIFLVSCLMKKLKKYDKTLQIIKILEEKLGELNAEVINKTTQKELENICKLFNDKSFFNLIHSNSEKMVLKFNGSVPSTINDYDDFVGFDSSIYNFIIHFAYSNPIGIIYDPTIDLVATKMHWVVNTLNNKKLNNSQVIGQIEEWLPNDFYADFNNVVLPFGELMCKQKKCNSCPLALQRICPYYCEVNDVTLQKRYFISNKTYSL